ncbi:Accessory gene regulator protein B [Paenibacillus plantiphilus]|uniref:Accessory gene regulator protein B n=1 Tax=Paenibacillus plantiphilus TaxID=2905650 RepID=A0ABN8GMG1_9BACL|nr:accessory gene regulator B family protein [Paenibacillus plantiphilus]CAH1212721.1 Accessory gene regulator protein B [Paenibacillus plantiphilus]
METISYKLAHSLKNRVPSHPGSVEVYRFAIEALLSVINPVILALVISLLTGQISATCLSLVAMASLRMISGGLHFKKLWVCTLVTATTAVVASISDLGLTYIMVATSVSVLLALIYCPSRIKGQTRIPSKYFPLLRLIAVMLIASNFLIGSSIIAVTFLIQSLTLIRKGGHHNEPS